MVKLATVRNWDQATIGNWDQVFFVTLQWGGESKARGLGEFKK